jgi:hypothetical protein
LWHRPSSCRRGHGLVWLSLGSIRRHAKLHCWAHILPRSTCHVTSSLGARRPANSSFRWQQFFRRCHKHVSGGGLPNQSACLAGTLGISAALSAVLAVSTTEVSWRKRTRPASHGLAGIGRTAFRESSVVSATVYGKMRCYDHCRRMESLSQVASSRALAGPSARRGGTGLRLVCHRSANQRYVACARALLVQYRDCHFSNSRHRSRCVALLAGLRFSRTHLFVRCGTEHDRRVD